jgi:hypothetical protein
MPQTGDRRIVQYLPSARWSDSALALHEWWRSNHHGDRPPARSDFDPVDWGAILANFWMLDVVHAPIRFRFRLVGTAVTRQIRVDPTGRWLDEAMPHLTDDTEFMDRYRRCAEEKIAIWNMGKAVLRPDNPIKAIETLILPLSGPDDRTAIILALSLFHGEIGRSDPRGFVRSDPPDPIVIGGIRKRISIEIQPMADVVDDPDHV